MLIDSSSSGWSPNAEAAALSATLPLLVQMPLIVPFNIQLSDPEQLDSSTASEILSILAIMLGSALTIFLFCRCRRTKVEQSPQVTERPQVGGVTVAIPVVSKISILSTFGPDACVAPSLYLSSLAVLQRMRICVLHWDGGG